MSQWDPAWVFAFGLVCGGVLLAFLLLLFLIFGSERIDRINWRLNVDRHEQRQRGRLVRVMDGWQRQRRGERGRRDGQIIDTDKYGL